MSFIIHIGSHKTGTTAVQRFAAKHRKALRSRGLWYPSYADIGIADHYGHHDFAHAVADREGRLTIDDAHRFVQYIRRKRRKREKVLISAEPMYRHVIKGDPDLWEQRAAYVRRLGDVFGVEDVTVLAVFRRQDTFARSLYQEKVKARRYAARFRQFLTEQRYEFEYHRQVSLFAKVFGSVMVETYEDLKKTNLINAFYANLGIDVSDFEPPTEINRSLPIELVEYKRLLNATECRRVRLQQIVPKLDGRAAKEGLAGDIDWITREEMEEFYNSFNDENERLRRDFANDRPAPLFPSLIEQPIPDRQEYGGMTMHRFAQLTADMLL